MDGGQLMNLGLGIIGTLLTMIASRIANDLGRLTKSVEALNVSVATVIARMDAQEERTNSFERRLDRFEEKITM